MKKYFDFIWICIWSIVLAATPVYGTTINEIMCEMNGSSLILNGSSFDSSSTIDLCDFSTGNTKCESQIINNFTSDSLSIILNLRGVLSGLSQAYFYVKTNGETSNSFLFKFEDHDFDGDVDGKDIYSFSMIYNGDVISLQSLAGGFGK